MRNAGRVHGKTFLLKLVTNLHTAVHNASRRSRIIDDTASSCHRAAHPTRTKYLPRGCSLRGSRRRFIAIIPSCDRWCISRRWRFAHHNALAGVVVTDFVAVLTSNFNAFVAIDLIAVLAYQWADLSRASLDDFKRIETCDFHVKSGAGIFIKQIQRALRSRIPVAVRVAGETTDPAQFRHHPQPDVRVRSRRGGT